MSFTMPNIKQLDSNLTVKYKMINVLDSTVFLIITLDNKL